jgi:predicted Zn-dependent protease
VRDINAFALPGGPMFINRGMIDSAHSEGEVVGVMAHELSHVLLRHGTANATKAQGFQLGALAGMIAGAVVGGGVGSIISQGSQLGLGTWLLRYSRDYEKQADLLGVQMMARAGYDPRDLARVFENIEKQGGGGSPQWMSDHPNPGNRSQYIEKEASMLQIANVRHDAGDLAADPARKDRARRQGSGIAQWGCPHADWRSVGGPYVYRGLVYGHDRGGDAGILGTTGRQARRSGATATCRADRAGYVTRNFRGPGRAPFW